MKRVVSVIFMFAVLFLFNLVGNAVDSPGISDINEAFWWDSGYSAYTANGEKVTNLSQLSLLTGEELMIPLPDEAFLDYTGSIFSLPEGQFVTLDMLREAGIDVKFRIEAGGQVLEKISLKMTENHTAIMIHFVKEYAFTKELQFDYTLYLTINGEKRLATEIRIQGQIGNPVILIEDAEYVDISSGEVVEALAYIKNIEVNLGNDVKAFGSFYEGSRYYGIAQVETNNGDYALLENYPEVELIYTLRTIGLKQEGIGIIFFDMPDKYFAYNKHGNYLGTTDKKLPYSAVYYLAHTHVGNIDFLDH